MATVTFDTLKFVRRLKEAGVPETQAEAFADALREAQGESDLVTKADLRAELADLRAELAELKSDLIKWLIGIMGFMTTLFVVIVKFL
jgi:hypothetical protein